MKHKEPVTLETLAKEGFNISQSQYDQLALVDISCNCKCSTYEILQVLKILGLI